jgi:hypothetical protein
LKPTTNNFNRTYNYLLAAIKILYPELRWQPITVLNVYVDDFEFNFIEGLSLEQRKKEINGEHIYILIDTYGEFKYGKHLDRRKSLSIFNDFVKEYSKAISCIYPLNGELDNNLVVIQIKFDSQLIKRFIAGEYSKLYNRENPLRETIVVKANRCKNPYWQITTKDSDYAPTFKKNIKSVFGTTLSDTDILDGREFDLPPNLFDEVLNYSIYEPVNEHKYEIV